jgi:hypothetical protein
MRVISIHFDSDQSLVIFQLLGYLQGILDNTKSSRSWQLSEAPFWQKRLADKTTCANVFRRTLCAQIYKTELNFRIEKEMSRRFLEVETKRLILTCFETFIEANGKQVTKTNITNKVNSTCAILLYILASEFEPSVFPSPIKHFSELHVSFCD